MDNLIALHKGENCVVVNGDGISISVANRLANQLGLSIRFAPYASIRSSTANKGSTFVVNAELFRDMPEPYAVVPPTGLWVSQNNVRNLSTYFGIESEWFFLLFTLMGTIQLKSLVKNDLLRQEDLIHNKNCDCLFSRHTHFAQWLRSLEDIRICTGSASFYRYLGCENELISLKLVVDRLREVIS